MPKASTRRRAEDVKAPEHQVSAVQIKFRPSPLTTSSGIEQFQDKWIQWCDERDLLWQGPTFVGMLTHRSDEVAPSDLAFVLAQTILEFTGAEADAMAPVVAIELRGFPDRRGTHVLPDLLRISLLDRGVAASADLYRLGWLTPKAFLAILSHHAWITEYQSGGGGL